MFEEGTGPRDGNCAAGIYRSGAVLQAALISLSAFAALEGDEWVADCPRMASLLAIPFLGFLPPALWLMKRNRLDVAASLAGAGVAVFSIVWLLV